LPRSTIGARLVVPQPASTGPFYRYNYVERQVYLSAWHISPAHLDDYIEGFDRYRPQVLTGLAHSYYLLAQLMLQAGRSLVYRPRAAIMGSEKLTADMRRAIAEAFRTRVFEEYGSVENCVLATECERGRLHLSPDLGALEVVDSKGDPVPAGEPGRFVCTGFLDYVQPLVRYEIGDIGVRSSEPCPCGRDHMPVLERIVGRENDALILRDGRRVATGEEILSGVAGVVEGQLVQEDFEEFTVKVVATPDFGEEQCRQIEAGLLSRVGEATVTVVRVDHLDRGPTGKFRPVVSKLTAPPATGTP
jgi:phenylacetate-CoA ligase